MGKLYSFISALLIAVGSLYAVEPSGYEWWLDNDVSSVTSGVFPAGKLDLQINTSDLPRGAHYFNCRLNTAEGMWGAVYRRMFYSIGKDQGAIGYEYWFDDDHDSKEAGTLTEGKKTFGVNLTSLSPGIHYFNCRLNSNENEWGAVYRKMVFTTPTGIDAAAYEYWIDDKYGSKIEGDIAEGSNAYTVELSGIRRGLHRFNYRIRTGTGTWGSVYSNYFYIDPNASFTKTYEYWLDDDYVGRQTMTSASNTVSFNIDLSGFDKTSAKPHFFNLRVFEEDNPESSSFYRKLIVPFKGIKAPIIGYHHYANGVDLGYVPVERQLVDSYMFEVNLPDSMRFSVKGKTPIFDGDKISIAGKDSIDYIIRIETELGWGIPSQWNLDVTNPYSTTAVEMAMNSRHSFAVPKVGEFAAVKFTVSSDSIYFRTDLPISLDLYRKGEKVTEISASELSALSMLKLEAGEYYGILRDAEKTSESGKFTFHLMDTPNSVPMPKISYEEGMVSISCNRNDAKIYYTLDKSEPSEESILYNEPFELLHNALIKAKAYVPDSDIEPSPVAEFVIDSYKASTPTGEFNRKEKTLTIRCETEGAQISYRLNPEHEWLSYEAPVKIRKNGTVYAKASFPDYNDSDEAEIKVTELPDSIPAPKIEFAEGKVTMSSDIEDAVIRYVIGDSIPNVGSTLYEASFPLAHNAVVRAIAYIPDTDIEPSRVAECIVDSYKVATPECKYDFPSRILSITCSTDGAAISYRIGDDGEWTAYKDPVRIARNCTVFAKATLKDFNDSDEEQVEITNFPDVMPDPEISFENGKVTISCGRDDVRFRYTLDKTEPTMESTLYEYPFDLAYNAEVWAIAYIPDSDVAPSGIAKYVVDSYKVATPTGVFDMPSMTMTLSCSTEGAKISYRVGVAGDWKDYSEPFTVGRNCIVYAKASFDGYNDSDVAEIAVTGFPDSMPQPVITFADGMVTITCERKDAEIRYTLDKTVPTMESILYERPFALARNATVWAIAYIPNSDIEPSEVTEYIVDSYKTATPTGAFDMPSRTMTLSCATKDATISYRIGASGEWTEYTAPFTIGRNCTVYAKATFDGYNDSEIAEIAVTGFPDSMPQPVISFKDGMVTISCERKDAEIRYTLDNTVPTMESTLYTGPFAVTRNATVKAIAYIPNSDIEPSDITEFVIDTYKVATPTGVFDMPSRTMTLSCSTEGAKISYRIGQVGEWTEYSKPFTIGRNCTVYAKATLEGYNESEMAEIPVAGFPDSMPQPVITFADGKVTITCQRSDAEIRYTIDGSVPTMESTLYAAPFAVTRNMTIKAIAYIPNSEIEPSDITEFVIDTYKVATPTGVFDMPSRTMTLSCATERAVISYRIGTSGEWTEYKAPFTIGRNCIVYAMATFDGYNDSDVAEIAVTDFPDSMPKPAITFADGMVSISSSRSDAEIRYTIDGSDPTMGSTLYTAPFAVTRNATIKAIAYIPDSEVEPSEIAEYVVDSFKTATPTGAFDMASRTMALSCATDGAVISYRIGVIGDWTVYAGPITIGRNCTVYAKASFDGYNDSDVAEIAVTGFPDSMPQPVITFADGMVTITCERTDAEIRYTLDRTVPTMESTLYEGPFALNRNATVWAIAYIPNSDLEPSEISELVVNSYQTATPTGDFDYETGTLRLECETEGAAISYTFNPDDEWMPYTGPIAIEGNCTVYAKAIADGYNESEMLVMEIGQFKCSPVEIDYDGRYVTMRTEDTDAEIRYSVILPDGVIAVEDAVYSGRFDVETLCQVSAKAVKAGHQDSETTEYDINFYGDEVHAETSAGGLLKSCYGWSDGETLNGIDEFRIEGTLNDTDYEFLKSMKGLRHLDIERVAEARIPDNAFKGTRLISISMPASITEYGDDILSDCDRLSAVIWNSKTSDIGSRLTDGLVNPNVLLYVSSEINVENPGDRNVIVDGVASSVILHDEYPFDVPREFTAEKISFTRNFDMETPINGCSGWESIVLPFTPDSILHERAGRIVPFKAWEEDEFADLKPFWLYKSNSSGWEEAGEMEACVPYIISMPNNEAYMSDFNIAGNVSFVASDVWLTPDSVSPKATPWIDGTQFTGTFLPVEIAGVRSINVNGEDDRTPGSAFVEKATTKPFGAYITGTSKQNMPIFGNWDAVLLPSLGSDGLKVYSPAPGTLRISSNCRRKVFLTTMTGANLRTIWLSAGETVTVEGLTRDIYIVGGIKVTVR